MNKTFGELVKEARVKKGLTIQALADELKLSTTYIYKMENDDIPNKEVLVDLCKALGLNIKKMVQLAIETKTEEYKQQLEKRYKI